MKGAILAKAMGVGLLEMKDDAAGEAAGVVGAAVARAGKAAEVPKAAKIEGAEVAGANVAMAVGVRVLEDIVCMWDDLPVAKEQSATVL